MKQVLAVLAAVVLIGGAYYVRTEFIESDEDPASQQEADQGPSGDSSVVCDALLERVCPSGAVVRDGAALVEDFAAPDVAHDVVVAPLTMVEMVQGSGRSRVTFDQPQVLGASPIVLVAPIGRADDVEGCDWACLQQLVADEDIRPGWSDPSVTSDGIAALAALAGGFFETNDLPFNRNSFSGAFLGWIDAVQQAARTSASPVDDIVRFNSAMNDTALVTEADAADALGRAGADRLVLSYPEPLAVLTAVVVGVEGTDPGEVADQVGEALRAEGWRDPGGDPLAEDAPALPDDDGLPDGGVLVALRDFWSN